MVSGGRRRQQRSRVFIRLRGLAGEHGFEPGLSLGASVAPQQLAHLIYRLTAEMAQNASAKSRSGENSALNAVRSGMSASGELSGSNNLRKAPHNAHFQRALRECACRMGWLAGLPGYSSNRAFRTNLRPGASKYPGPQPINPRLVVSLFSLGTTRQSRLLEMLPQ